jgi:transcriptional regulator with XRE-family HTH domain
MLPDAQPDSAKPSDALFRLSDAQSCSATLLEPAHAMKTKSKQKRRNSAAKFKMSMVFTIYEMTKEGFPAKAIADVIGVHHSTLIKWEQEKLSVRTAFKEGLAARDEADDTSFFDFVAGRLPPELHDLWDELFESENDPSAIRRIEKLLNAAGNRNRQRLFLHALFQFDFNLTRALKFVSVSRTRYQGWLKNDPDFLQLITEVTEIKGDFYENALVRLVKRGVPAAVIHANKTFNADRGYATKAQLEITGEVTHTHKVVPLSDLELPLEVRAAMFDALQALKKKQEKEHVKRIDVTPAS